ncbi:hypothetical protein [Primorskyibacter sp. S187A]|uniref:hypothetical protein n=1 Tax=Primorskyibacter sp. S187A TaxID=3415130 RepID=UPI003C7C24B1
MKKAFIITALILTAGSASALSQSDVTRYNIDVNALTATEKATASAIIHGGSTPGEVQAFISNLQKQSSTRSN